MATSTNTLDGMFDGKTTAEIERSQEHTEAHSQS